MKTLEKDVLKSLFSDNQITQLQEVFDTCKKEYLEALDLDPFTNDTTDEEVKDLMCSFLKEKYKLSTSISYNVEHLYTIVYTYFF